MVRLLPTPPPPCTCQGLVCSDPWCPRAFIAAHAGCSGRVLCSCLSSCNSTSVLNVFYRDLLFGLCWGGLISTMGSGSFLQIFQPFTLAFLGFVLLGPYVASLVGAVFISLSSHSSYGVVHSTCKELSFWSSVPNLGIWFQKWGGFPLPEYGQLLWT